MATITFEELVNEVTAEVDKAYEHRARSDVLQDIKAIRNELRGLGISGKIFEQYTKDELSRMNGMLATLRASLEEPRSKALKNKYIAAGQLKVRRASVRDAVRATLTAAAKNAGKKPPTKDDIEVEVNRQLVKTQLFFDLHSARYEEYQSRWYSIPAMCQSIETRIRVLDGDKSTSRHYGYDNESASIEIPDMGEHAATGQMDYSDAMRTN